MKNSIRYPLLTCVLGYILIVASAMAISMIFRVVTGYFPSFTFFTLALITFRLVELHQGFIIAPLAVTTVTMALLSKTPIQRRVVAGLSMSSYYLVVALIFVIKGGEFSLVDFILWVLWVFVLGVMSSILVDRTI